jgi:DNA-binding MarR family transcriptional regulator
MHVHAALTSALDEVLRDELGIPASWYEALVEIAFAGGSMRMSDFARETTLTKSGATRFADRLEEAGLVERRVCPEDRRGLELVLTEEGKRMQKRADPFVLETMQNHFGQFLRDDEAMLVADVMSRVTSQLDEIE